MTPVLLKYDRIAKLRDENSLSFEEISTRTGGTAQAVQRVYDRKADAEYKPRKKRTKKAKEAAKAKNGNGHTKRNGNGHTEADKSAWLDPVKKLMLKHGRSCIMIDLEAGKVLERRMIEDEYEITLGDE